MEDLSVIQARLLWCYEGEVWKENLHAVTRERHLFAWWLQRGSVTLKSGSQSYGAKAGQWLFGGPQLRRQDFSDDAVILSVSFRLTWPSGDSLIHQPLVVNAKEFPKLGISGRTLVRFIRRHFSAVRNELWRSSADLVSFFELQSLFSSWITAYLRAVQESGIVPARMSGIDPRVVSALRQLDRLPWSVPFQEKELAREIGLSVGHLDRLFVQQMGFTPRAYWQKRRYETAVGLLSEVDTPVKKIGYDLGFSSPGHFSHWFRQASGQSPRQFRVARPTRKRV